MVVSGRPRPPQQCSRGACGLVEFIHGPLAEAPERVGKPLRAPLDGLHSERRGDYRVLYEIHGDRVVVVVVRVDHRRDVYRS
ncbi:type II toxin-antitoxin system RelE/ParE family toxin [Klenkia sp. LSe6-5]|uniref:Type II toxin-antitoxin system RelE/ParE family toxin n=1 Tax=Klenkia sesuvii TaxID=3103137 RepID=A0ABU8DSB3_9ACTN